MPRVQPWKAKRLEEPVEAEDEESFRTSACNQIDAVSLYS